MHGPAGGRVKRRRGEGKKKEADGRDGGITMLDDPLVQHERREEHANSTSSVARMIVLLYRRFVEATITVRGKTAMVALPGTFFCQW